MEPLEQDGVDAVDPAPVGRPRAERVSGPHFQLYAMRTGEPVRWRLLSGNNRDLGRAAHAYDDEASCRTSIAEMLGRLTECQGVVRPNAQNRWGWILRYDGAVIATSGHNHDRQIRCERALAMFLDYSTIAVVDETVTYTAPRRPSNSARTDGARASRSILARTPGQPARGRAGEDGLQWQRLGPHRRAVSIGELPVISPPRRMSRDLAVES